MIQSTHKPYQKILSFNLAIALIFTGCVTSPRDIESSHPVAQNGASIEEIEIGQKIHAQIMSSFYPYTAPKVTDYVRGVGEKLILSSKTKNLPYEFTILYSDKVYAASAPGGHIYITTGLLYFAYNEAELASALAHEIAFVNEFDMGNKKAAQSLTKITRTAAMIAPAFGQIGALTAMGFAMLETASQAMRMSPEEKVYRADQKAMQYMVNAGYDPQGMIDFVGNCLYAKDRLMPLFSDYDRSHFINSERKKRLESEFLELPLAGKSLNTNFKQYHEITRGVREMYQVA